MRKICSLCLAKAKEWKKKCLDCGFTLVLEPEEKSQAKYLRTPSLGALLFTQGWTLGARLYILFFLSLIPIVGIPILVVCVLFGRHLSWRFGGWSDWSEFTKWMRIMDIIGVVWVMILVIAYFLFKK